MGKNSKIVFAVIAVSWFLLSSYQKNWSRNQMKSDIGGYYAYLPAVFIYHDLYLANMDQTNDKFKNSFWPSTAPNGGRVIKYSMGLSIMYLPFFIVAHYIVAPVLGFASDGYSDAYQSCLAIGAFIYLFLGLIYLRKILLRFYSEKVTILTIVSVFFGTNLLWYAFGEALMAHQFLFALTSIMIYCTLKWYDQPVLKYAVGVALTGGLIILIRPVDGLLLLFPLLYGEPGKEYINTKLSILKKYWIHIVLMIGIVTLVQAPQLIYWKMITGNWLYDSYPGEKFFWTHPHIIDGLFSYRKGWLLYTPIMLFSLAGFFALKNETKKIIIPLVIVFFVFTYIVFCWWIWWYGGSFSTRPYVDIYPLLAIPMGAAFAYLLKRNVFRKLLWGIIPILILINMFQTWQYNIFILHYDAMTKESYFGIFGRIEKPENWWRTLRLTDPIRTIKGLPEDYKKDELLSGSFYLRNSNNQLLISDSAKGIAAVERPGWTGAENFILKKASKNSVLILARGKFCSLNPKGDNLGLSEETSNAREFELNYLGDNKIELVSYPNKTKGYFRIYMAE